MRMLTHIAWIKALGPVSTRLCIFNTYQELAQYLSNFLNPATTLLTNASSHAFPKRLLHPG